MLDAGHFQHGVPGSGMPAAAILREAQERQEGPGSSMMRRFPLPPHRWHL
jgi:hypothetical protein